MGAAPGIREAAPLTDLHTSAASAAESGFEKSIMPTAPPAAWKRS
jgi:hypothetical protein